MMAGQFLDAGAWQRGKCCNASGLTPNREGTGIVSKASLPLSRFTVLDLTTKDGLAIFMKLAEKADVIVENFRSEVKFRLGVDYESVKKINPRIVFGSISGFGQSGPYAKRPGVDQIAQGMGGLMSITG